MANQAALAEKQTFLDAIVSYPGQVAGNPRITFDQYYVGLVVSVLARHGMTCRKSPSRSA